MDKEILCEYFEEAACSLGKVIQNMIEKDNVSGGDIIDLLGWVFLVHIKVIYNNTNKSINFDEFLNVALNSIEHKSCGSEEYLQLKKGKARNENTENKM